MNAGRAWAITLLLATLAMFPGVDGGYERFHAPKLAVLLCGLMLAGRAQLGAGGAVLLGWLGVSALLSAAPVIALVPVLIGLVALGAFSLARSLDEGGRALVRGAIVGSGGLVACLVLAEAWGGLRLFAQDGRSPSATLGQRNLVAALLVLSLPFAVRWALVRPRVLAAVAVLCAALVHTRSRAGWLMALVAVVGSLAVELAPGARKLVVLAASVSVVLVAGLLPSQLRWRSPHPLRDTAVHLVDPSSPSGAGRVTRWKNSAPLLRSVFGVGPGHWAFSYAGVSPPEDLTWDHQHVASLGRRMNGDLVALAVELGPAFVVLALGLLVRVIRGATEFRFACVFVAVCGGLAALDVLVQVPLLAAIAGTGLGSLARPVEDRPVARKGALVVLVLGSLWACAHAAGVFVRTRPGATVDSLVTATRLAPSDFEGGRAAYEVLVLEQRCGETAPLAARLGPVLVAEPSFTELSRGCSVNRAQ